MLRRIGAYTIIRFRIIGSSDPYYNVILHDKWVEIIDHIQTTALCSTTLLRNKNKY